jgi:hypothetical protein
MTRKEAEHMPIVKYKNQSGIEYAYDQTSVYDPVKKQSRPVRKYLGRVDPETGEIISTKGKRGRPPKAGKAAKHPEEASAVPGVPGEEMVRELEALRARLQEKEEENRELKERCEALMNLLSSIKEQIDNTIH